MTHRLEQLDNIPQQMKEHSNWLLWKLIQQEGRPKPTKMPFHTETFKACDPTSTDNWVKFEKSYEVYKNNFNSFDGLGFCLSKETGICFVDLDDCLNGEGHLEPWAKDVLDQLPKSFIEVSQSGNYTILQKVYCRVQARRCIYPMAECLKCMIATAMQQ